MVMPRAFSSGAASIWSYALASPPNIFDRTVVIAAVRVVLPWSTCPIVPTFTCGLVRSNLALAIVLDPGVRLSALVSPIGQKDDTCFRRPLAPIAGSSSRLIVLHQARDRDRTGDLILTKDALYRLSYASDPFVSKRATGLEPATLSLEG